MGVSRRIGSCTQRSRRRTAMPFQAKKKEEKNGPPTMRQLCEPLNIERGRKRRNKRAYGKRTKTTSSSTVCVCIYIVPPPLLYVCQYNSPSIHPSLLHPPTIAAGYILFAPAEKGGYYVACLLFNGTTQKPSGSGSFKSLLHTTAHRLCMYVCVCIYREKRRHAGNYGGIV